MPNSFLIDLENLMCPPGNGVFTVNTAKERKDELHHKLFNVSGDEDKVNEAWKKKLADINSYDKAFMLGVCSDCGGGILRGANWGPLFIRNEILKSSARNYLDIGDIRVIPHLLHDKYLNPQTLASCRDALYKDSNAAYSVSPLSITYDVLSALYKYIDRAGVFSMGGDHSVSYPLVKSYLEYAGLKGKKVGLLHFDAHTDLLTKRLGIDLCF